LSVLIDRSVFISCIYLVSAVIDIAGNHKFRQLVEHSAPLYVAARTKLEKTQVIASVVDKVRRDSPGCGGFVKRDFHTGLWFEIGDDKARDKVGHAIRRAVKESKNKKELRSKQANKKSNKHGKTSDDDNSETSSLLGHEKNVSAQLLGQILKEKSNKAASQKQRGEGQLASLPPTGSHRGFPPGTGAGDSLVVPPFLYSTRDSNIDASHSLQHSSEYTHSMQHNLVVPPGSANASTLFSQQESMGLLSRGHTSRPAGDSLLGGSSSTTSQCNHPETASGSALISNHQFNPVLLDGLMFPGDAGSLNNQFNEASGGASQPGGFSMLNHLNAAAMSGSFTNPSLANHQINITSSGLANRFGQVNDPAADSTAWFSNQFNQMGDSSLFAGSSNHHLASLAAMEDGAPLQYSQQQQRMPPPIDFQPQYMPSSWLLSAPVLGASADSSTRNNSILFTTAGGLLSASSPENHLLHHHSGIFPTAALANQEAGAQGAAGDPRRGRY
jgi:hypothetical protein